MLSRRSVFVLMGSLLGLPFASPSPTAAFAEPGLEIRRHGRHYIVNGWVLSARDLRLLGLDAR